MASLGTYISSGSKSVDGWLSRVDVEIIRTLLAAQSNFPPASVAEIGVHHGRLFIAMCLALKPTEKAYCVDVFDNQSANKDDSGRGNRDIFTSNLRRFGVDEDRVVINSNSSEDVSADDIVKAVGHIRFFSVDGGHWLDIVNNDLTIAEEALAEHGVIALDDFHRSEWPDVSAGYFRWFSQKTKPLCPFAIGFNKLYLCSDRFRSHYQDALKANQFVNCFLKKVTTFQDVELPVFHESFLPEFSFKQRVKCYLRTFHPAVFYKLRGWQG